MQAFAKSGLFHRPGHIDEPFRIEDAVNRLMIQIWMPQVGGMREPGSLPDEKNEILLSCLARSSRLCWEGMKS